MICRLQHANYTVTIFKQDTQDPVFVYGPRSYEWSEDNRLVQFSVDHVLESNTGYTGVVVVETVAGNKNVPFKFTIRSRE